MEYEFFPSPLVVENKLTMNQHVNPDIIPLIQQILESFQFNCY